MIAKQIWGTLPDGQEVFLYTLRNETGMEARISTYGGCLVSLLVPDKTGALQDVVLGYDTLDEYRTRGEYFGALVGRFANRIANARFTLDGKTYVLRQNDGPNCHHGGGEMSYGVWSAEEEGETLKLTFCSPDGANGFPGAMTATVRIRLDEKNAIHFDYQAVSDARTVVSLTNHAYFNFTGGRRDVLDHVLSIEAQQYTEVDENLLPAKNVPVEGTDFDFRTPRAVSRAVYDHNFILSGGQGPQASVYDRESGIYMEMFTDMPAVHIYASCSVPEYVGKNGCAYGPGIGLCLETQMPTNTPNRPDCQKYNYLVGPGEVWTSSTEYRFKVR